MVAVFERKVQAPFGEPRCSQSKCVTFEIQEIKLPWPGKRILWYDLSTSNLTDKLYSGDFPE